MYTFATGLPGSVCQWPQFFKTGALFLRRNKAEKVTGSRCRRSIIDRPSAIDHRFVRDVALFLRPVVEVFAFSTTCLFPAPPRPLFYATQHHSPSHTHPQSSWPQRTLLMSGFQHHTVQSAGVVSWRLWFHIWPVCGNITSFRPSLSLPRSNRCLVANTNRGMQMVGGLAVW